MHLSVELRYPAPVPAVGAMLADEEFVRWRAARSGGDGAHVEQVDVTGGPDEGFTVAVRRTLPTDQIPAHVRSFVGGRLEIRQAEVWEPERDGERSGTVSLEITGAPVRLTGTVTLSPRVTARSSATTARSRPTCRSSAARSSRLRPRPCGRRSPPRSPPASPGCRADRRPGGVRRGPTDAGTRRHRADRSRTGNDFHRIRPTGKSPQRSDLRRYPGGSATTPLRARAWLDTGSGGNARSGRCVEALPHWRWERCHDPAPPTRESPC